MDLETYTRTADQFVWNTAGCSIHDLEHPEDRARARSRSRPSSDTGPGR